MSTVIVPLFLHDELNRLLDAEIEKHPAAAKDREVLYSQLLGYVNEHGVIPDFSLAPVKAANCIGEDVTT